MTDCLNPEALEQQAVEAAAKAARVNWSDYSDWGRANESTRNAYRDLARATVSAYLTALPAPRTITGEQVNLAGWTCYGIHEPGSYATCEECRDACDDLANFYNSMHRNPVAGKTWTGQPTEGGGE